MHWYLTVTRLLGIFPYSSRGFSNCWMAYSLAIHVCILIPLHLGRIYTAIEGYDSIALRTSVYINGVVSSYINIVHLWQLWNNRQAVQVLAMIEKYLSLPSAWKISIITLGFHQTTIWITIFYREKWYTRQANVFPAISEFTCSLIIVQFLTCINRLKQEITDLTRSDNKNVLSDPEAVDRAQWVSDFFSPQIGLMCVKSFLHGLFFTFRFIDLYRTESFVMQASKVTLIAYSLIFTVMVVRACDNFQQTVRAFRAKVFRIVMNSQDLCASRSLCTHLLLKKNVKFSACGLFPIGYPIITSIIAATASYLVMLVQLGGNKN